VLTDYRAVFASLFQHLYGLQTASIHRFSPVEIDGTRAGARARIRIFPGVIRIAWQVMR
jgi:hypothetical protein